MRPLDRVRSIKMKLGTVIVAAVAGTTGAIVLGLSAGLDKPYSALIAAAVGLIAIQFFARGMTSPLREMASAAKAMAKGDYSRRVTATSRDEVGELARAFNSMAAELAEVDRMRKDLVANVSHELRTPITALQAVLENIVDGVESPDDPTLRTMLTQVERLGRLVDQLLDLSRLESGVLQLEKDRFAVRELLQQAADEARMRNASIGNGHVRFELDVRPDDLTALGDVERVHQVLANLLDNALRHSPDGGAILLQARPASGGVQLSVSDDGPGIPDEEAGRVFERFYRTDRARSSLDGGTGLGLAIARWIVDLHGGDIRVENRLPHGCRMVFELPARAA